MCKSLSNAISWDINSLPTNLSTITITSNNNNNNNTIWTGCLTGITTSNICINGVTTYPYSYYPPLTAKEIREKRKNELIDECEKDPELFNEVLVELRKRKIQKLKSKI